MLEVYHRYLPLNNDFIFGLDLVKLHLDHYGDRKINFENSLFGNKIINQVTDLDKIPKIIAQEPFFYSGEYFERPIVYLVQIKENGNVNVLETISSKSASRSLIKNIKLSFEKTIYERPRKNNEPVSVQFKVPVFYSSLTKRDY